MMGHFFMLINIFLLPASLLMAAPTMNLDPLVTTNMPPSSMTEVEHLQRLSSGLQALDAIAVSQVTNIVIQFCHKTTTGSIYLGIIAYYCFSRCIIKSWKYMHWIYMLYTNRLEG